jgi:acetyl esterase/lipase
MAKEHGLDARRVVVIGHSAGGQLAVCLAARESSLRGVVSLAGVLNLQRTWELHLSNDAVVEFLGGTPASVADHYREADPMQVVIAGVPQRIVHGKNDDVVPPAFGRDYVVAKKARGERVELIEIEKCGHFDVIDPRSGAWREVERAVMELLS